MNILNGKLSYILAIFAIVGGGAGYVLGFIDSQTALNMVWGGLALFGVRRAISNL